MSDVAIAHKDYLVRGGGEALVEELAQTFDAPLFIGGSHDDVELQYDRTKEVRATSRQRWFINRGGLLRALAYMAVWQNEDRLTEYDTVITSGNEPLWYVPEPEQTVVSYCHSPPRTMYDLNHNTGRGMLGALLRAGKRTMFQHNVLRPDAWVANSESVARRMARYLGIPREQIRVVYPPVDTAGLRPNNAETGDYYLCLGRLAAHKRVDVAVDAFSELDARLVVAGRGPQFDAIHASAGENVDVLGFVDETRKRELYAGAKALIFPAQAEDFGMVPIEAMASGTPVLGVEEGFTQFQIADGKNGLIFEPTARSLRETVRQFEADGVAWGERRIATFADQFSTERFRDEMHDVVRHAQERTKPTVEIQRPGGVTNV